MTTVDRLTRPARLLAVALALVAGAAAGTASAPSHAAASCDGVWVVVDATRLGGSVRTLCAPGSPTSGLDALRLAGVDYSFVERQPGLVCTLDGQPDPCNGAPTDAYWGYWHADAGGEWVYSNRGAGNRTPTTGSVEGWAFGAGEPPGRAPPAAAPEEPEPEPEPEPAPSPEPEPSPAATAAPAPKASASDDPAAAGTDPEPSETGAERVDDPPASEAEPADGSDEVPVADADADDEPDGEPDDATPLSSGDEVPDDEVALGDVAGDGGGGAPVGVIAGGVLVAGLAGAGLLRARRRDDLGEG